MGRQLLVQTTIPCSICKKDFKKMYWNHKFCDDCRLIRDKAHKKRSQLRIAARRKIKQKICKHCFCLFRLYRGERIYCTRKCTRRAARIVHLQKRIVEMQAEIQKLTGTGGEE